MVSPEAIAAAWATWHSRHGGKLGPGPAFSEAITAALEVDGEPIRRAGLIAGLREAAGIAAFRSILLSSPDESTGAHKAFEAIHARIAALETEEGKS